MSFRWKLIKILVGCFLIWLSSVGAYAGCATYAPAPERRRIGQGKAVADTKPESFAGIHCLKFEITCAVKRPDLFTGFGRR